MLRDLILRIPQPVRFVTAGGTVFVVQTCSTLLLTLLMDIQLAIPIGYCIGLALQFNLQRYYVFANHDEFHLETHQQLVRYLATAAVQYAIVALLTHVLPGLLGVDEQIVYVALVFVAAILTYAFTRAFVFHGGDGDGEVERASAHR